MPPLYHFQETTYTKPAALGGAATAAGSATSSAAEWKEVQDANGKPYYWNTVTNVSGIS